MRRVLPLLVSSFVLLGASPALAGGWGATTTRSGGGWGVTGAHGGGAWSAPLPPTGKVSSTPSTFATTDGNVYAMAKLGKVLYIAGDFTHVTNPGGATVAVTRLAAIDTTTGALVGGGSPTFAATADGAVRSIEPSADGSTLYIGGDFITVDGVSHHHIAAVDAVTGAVSSWAPSADNSVWAIAATSSRVYIGGDFLHVNATPAAHLAAIGATSGTLVSGWSAGTDNEPYHTQLPSNTDGRVQALALSLDGSRLYVGGYINRVWHLGATTDAVVRPGAASLFAADGSVDLTFKPPFTGGTGHDGNNPFAFVVSLHGRLIVAIGGKANQLYSVDPSTGATQWRDNADGDFQTVVANGTSIYAGGHFHTTVHDGAGAESAVEAVKVSPKDGGVDKSWNPHFVYNPNQVSTYYGVWSLYADGTDLYAGGAFLSVGGGSHPHLARFAAS